MRVIGGMYGGRKLRMLEGLAVRPTSDRLRETLFNILAPDIKGASFLDICAGSGAVGIEALSRGAHRAWFIEKSRRACAVIEQNLQTLGALGNATIINRDAAAALKRLELDGAHVDVAFIDPPYASEIYSQLMKLLAESALLQRDAIVIAEHRVKAPPLKQYCSLRLYRSIKQGESGLAFYALTPVADEAVGDQ